MSLEAQKNEQIVIIESAFNKWDDLGRTQHQRDTVNSFIKILLKQTSGALGGDFLLSDEVEEYLYHRYGFKTDGFKERNEEYRLSKRVEFEIKHSKSFVEVYKKNDIEALKRFIDGYKRNMDLDFDTEFNKRMYEYYRHELNSPDEENSTYNKKE